MLGRVEELRETEKMCQNICRELRRKQGAENQWEVLGSKGLAESG